MKLVFLILLLCVSIAASQSPNKRSVTLLWDPNPTSQNVTVYRVYELVKSHRVLIGESKSPRFEIRRQKGKHVYVVTAVSGNSESMASSPVEIEN
jgi:hypothetical protein